MFTTKPRMGVGRLITRRMAVGAAFVCLILLVGLAVLLARGEGAPSASSPAAPGHRLAEVETSPTANALPIFSGEAAKGDFHGTANVNDPTVNTPPAIHGLGFQTKTTRPQETFSQYARIKTWYTPATASNNAYVHFKTVDADGYTVMQVPGSDLINLKYETYSMNQTPKRRNLVDRLRGMMQDDGWTELRVDGDWYEYVFAR